MRLRHNLTHCWKSLLKRLLLTSNERGMALLITVMILSLLIAVTVQFYKTTWHKFVVSDNYKKDVQLKSISESGINIALAVLENDLADNQPDSLLDSWTLIEKENFDNLFPTGELELKIVDLSGRLQINSIVDNIHDLAPQLQTVLFNILISEDFPVESETEAREIVDALVDWIDADETESDYGAETSYYQSLDPPYSARNGPVTTIDELLLVRGITPELFFGSTKTKGLNELLTAYGDDGKININTTDPLIVRGMNPLITEHLTEQFDDYRQDEDHSEKLNDPGWYKNIGWPGDIKLNTKLLTTKSRYFQITARAKSDTLSRTIVADVERSEDGTLTLLRKKME